jgi:hypothetical protein
MIALMMEAVTNSEMSVFYETGRRHIAKGCDLNRALSEVLSCDSDSL